MMNLSNKRVAVTGGAGFLGSYVVETLLSHGCRDPFVPRRRDYDLTTGEAMERFFRSARPEVVIHLAASVGGIGANRDNPGRFFFDNVMMGILLLEHARRFEVEKTVVVGTICSYPKHTPLPFKEEALWDGYPEETNAPYGIAKKALLVQCQAYRQQYGMNAVFLMPTNLYGPRDNFDTSSSHVIPALIRKCLHAKRLGEPAIVLWGDGSPTREFLHVRDAAEGLVRATEGYDGPDPVNLGSGQEISIRDLAALIARCCEYEGAFVWDTTKPNGQPRRRLDTRKAEEWFGWKATVPLASGLMETIAWYTSSAPGIR